MISSKFKDAKILIVDDHQSNIDVLTELLELSGYKNHQATTDPKEAKSIFAGFKPDLILLDLGMPYLNGNELLRQLIQLIPADKYLPIIVMGTDTEQAAKEKALTDGAIDFLQKPFDLTEASHRIENLLEIKHLYSLQEKQNQLMHEKILERTMELEKTNTDLMNAKEKAEANDRLKTSFIQNMSQEVRTPLNGIIGIAEIITDPSLSDEEKNEFIPMLRTSSKRLMNTITDFVDISMIVSKNVKVNLKEISVTQEISEITGNFKTECKNLKINLSIETPANSESFILKTDLELFRKIVSHILRNAIINTKNESITIGYNIENKHVKFFIKATGSGFNKDLQDRIDEHLIQEFESNQRDKDENRISLSIIKEYINLLKGTLSFDTTKDDHSTFYFSLPIETTTPLSEKKETHSTYARNDRPVVLIVEDDETNRMFFSHVLKDYVSGMYHAENGKIAVDLCQKHGEISFVLMDLKMPVMNGYDATREIRTFRKKLPIIAITAYAMTGDEKLALEAGCDDYITKPINKKELINKLRSKSLLLEEGEGI
jgi:two-component system, sensor histidine kinase and response regulator